MVKKKVMIVDDEIDFLRITKMNLEKTEAYEVLALPNAKDLIAELHRFKPDVILLDVLMPGMSGIRACEELNNDPIGTKTPVIIISALERDKDKLRAYRLGVVDYLVKPVEKEVLISKIEKAIKYRYI
jgi:two-component system alkaline phosphatase synthesis response regulator PhoP